MPDQVPEDVKRERIERLIDVCQRVARARNAERVGRVEEVLVEGADRGETGLLRGRTRRNTTVNFAGTAAAGDLVEVRIEAATSTTLRGTQTVAAAAEASLAMPLSGRSGYARSSVCGADRERPPLVGRS
jgi:tRNA-2-methylthio-N6-dimethylallyladenosine synthase